MVKQRLVDYERAGVTTLRINLNRPFDRLIAELEILLDLVDQAGRERHSATAPHQEPPHDRHRGAHAPTPTPDAAGLAQDGVHPVRVQLRHRGPPRRRRRRPERADPLVPTRPLRRHAVAQDRPGPPRTGHFDVSVGGDAMTPSRIVRSRLPDVGIPDCRSPTTCSARRRPTSDRVAVIDGVDGSVWTRSALLDRIRRVAGGLPERGISAGATVALIAGNGPDFVVAFHAVTLTGATVTPINPSYGRERSPINSTTRESTW